jgi:hypothetical protein
MHSTVYTFLTNRDNNRVRRNNRGGDTGRHREPFNFRQRNIRCMQCQECNILRRKNSVKIFHRYFYFRETDILCKHRLNSERWMSFYVDNWRQQHLLNVCKEVNYLILFFKITLKEKNSRVQVHLYLFVPIFTSGEKITVCCVNKEGKFSITFWRFNSIQFPLRKSQTIFSYSCCCPW